MLFPISQGRREEDLANAIRFFLPRTIDELIRGLREVIGNELGRLQYLGPLRSYPPRHIAFAQHHDQNWFAGGGYAWDVVRKNRQVRDAVNAWLNSPERLQTPYLLAIRELVGAEDLQTPLTDMLQQAAELVNEEGVIPIFDDPESAATAFVSKVSSGEIDKINELILMDNRTRTQVSHRDVGIGISQVLPVLVTAYASRNKIIAMEQPEIHLHPALQGELGDVFIETALGERKNTMILETHSEHLMLRILRRIRETTANELPNGSIPVKPEDVAVLFVDATASGSRVIEIPILPDGEFARQWPQGFFDDRAKELF
ncbi:AAA family ATPase [Nitrospira sp. Nam80]